jgi:two-component system, NarL family, response regulator LiaR
MNKDPNPPSREHEPSRIVIADDHPLYRSALRQTVDMQPDLEVVGEAQNGREALDLCRRLHPEVVLMDVRMPEMDGLMATRAIKLELPGTIVLMLTAFEDPNYLSEALKSGAAGYVLKQSGSQEIIDAIRKVLDGEFALDQELATSLLRRLLAEVSKEPEPAASLASSPVESLEEHQRAPLLESFTEREVEVLRLVARGHTNQEIAQSLLVSVSTVKKYVHNIISKLEVSDRTQAAIRAIELGLLIGQEEEE